MDNVLAFINGQFYLTIAYISDGGTPKTLLRLLGGQGTMNVNSWSPDSRKIAFVSYRLNK